ncbi:hypothetical protein BVI434_2180003 [Burkholderia vietnamiensis]|nr:hypothetical protein BVI434_2180003 [Burkholderia vietnamiensis]
MKSVRAGFGSSGRAPARRMTIHDSRAARAALDWRMVRVAAGRATLHPVHLSSRPR